MALDEQPIKIHKVAGDPDERVEHCNFSLQWWIIYKSDGDHHENETNTHTQPKVQKQKLAQNSGQPARKRETVNNDRRRLSI